MAKRNGHGPKRSLLFMTVTGEEKGLLGSEFYSNHPVWPLDKTIANLNIDMIGRVDEDHEDDGKYVYIIGSDRLSLDLHMINEQVNKMYTGLELDYKYNAADDPNRFYFRSDHYNFARLNIPIIFYFNGTHQDYHQPTDTIDKIRFDLLKRRSDLIFYCAWELANREQRIRLNP
jgi:Zn-dependent M28 family amino/carboxypeptidase